MRTYDYRTLDNLPIPNDIVAYIAQIHEYKGRQSMLDPGRADVLEALVEVAKIQSTGASNRIEGIRTSDKRLQELAGTQVQPKNRDEEEILGYRCVLDTIHESYPYIPVNANVIRQLHRDLYRFSPQSFGGQFKNTDNVIEETDSAGNQSVRFQPLPAFETPAAVEALCKAYTEAVCRGKTDPLLYTMVFVLDFLCIHPFLDGNSRMSRLLTLLLLYQNGYVVGKYISLEALIEKTKEGYYRSLQQSSTGWHEAQNDIWPFIRYMLGILLAAYRDFENRVTVAAVGKMTKEQRVRKAVEETLGLFTKAEIMEHCPDIAMTTVEKVLADMKREGLITATGTGRGAKWRKQ